MSNTDLAFNQSLQECSVAMAVGLLGVAGSATRIFGPYWISSPLFLPLGAISSIWIIWLEIAIPKLGNSPKTN